MKRILLVLLCVVLFMTYHSPALAATPKKASSPSISVNPQFVKAKNTVRALFGNLKGVSKVTYTLMYDGNGVGQGVMGSFVPGKKTSFTRDLYLGTCSGKVCIKHRNIKNIQLEVTTKYTNGKSLSKVYKVK